MFAREHPAAKDVFQNKYHMFWSTTSGYEMWDPKNDASACPSSKTRVDSLLVNYSFEMSHYYGNRNESLIKIYNNS